MVASRVANEQDRVEATIARYGALVREAMRTYLPAREPRAYLYDLVRDYPLRGSKMLRSSLCIAVCRAFGGAVEDALDSAVAIELLHNAFLIHDDLEDGSERRRGGETLHLRHGIPLAVNAGDALSVLSFRPLARNVDRFGSRLAWRIFTETQHAMEQTVEGQALELGWRRDNADDVTPKDYLRMTLKKTCWYTTILPCRLGALVAGRRPLDPSFAVDFGLFLGAIFQIQDDVLNLVGGAERHGKTSADDIFEGKRSLALIHLFQTLEGRDRRMLSEILALPRERREPEHVHWILDQMQGRGSIDYARSCACSLAGAALHEFERTFEAAADSEDKQFIRDLCLYMIDRDG